MKFQKSYNIQGYRSWSAAQGHIYLLFSWLGPVIIKKTDEKPLSSIQGLIEFWRSSVNSIDMETAPAI